MNSEKLSARAKQPGHDRTFRQSEENFVDALHEILDETEWDIVDHPRDLARIFGDRYGVIPEASITYKPNGRAIYFEVKKQGPSGNADERACKHHTVQFYKTVNEVTGYGYHPFVTIMCQNLATDERYTLKHPYFFEEDHYLLWVGYDLDILADFVARITEKWIIGSPTITPDAIPE